MPEQMVCTPKLLPRHRWQSAAKVATEINPINHPPVESTGPVHQGFAPLAPRHGLPTLMRVEPWRTSAVQARKEARD
jgi:hypothetical protein